MYLNMFVPLIFHIALSLHTWCSCCNCVHALLFNGCLSILSVLSALDMMPSCAISYLATCWLLFQLICALHVQERVMCAREHESYALLVQALLDLHLQLKTNQPGKCPAH